MKRIGPILLLLALVFSITACASTDIEGSTPTEPTVQLPPQPNNWDVSEDFKLQVKQEYIQHMKKYACACTEADVQLAVVSHVDSGYAMLISCKCGSVDLNASWDDLMATGIHDLTFYMPKGWFLQFYTNGVFHMLDGAFNLQIITPEQVEIIWNDYYSQFPAAQAYYNQRHPAGSPTAEQERMLSDYHTIIQFLEEYDITERQGNALQILGDPMNYTSHHGVRYCYEKLQEMEEVDDWIDYCRERSSDDYLWERQAYLDRFTVVEDVLLQAVQYTISPGFISRSGTRVWYYDSEGRLYYDKTTLSDDFYKEMYLPGDYYSFEEFFLYYDSTGRVEKFLKSKGYYTYTPHYDSSGRITSMTIQERDSSEVRTITYTYDTDGRLICTELTDSPLQSSNYRIEYSYDDNGRLSRRVETCYNGSIYDYLEPKIYIERQKIMDYRYDTQGVLESATYTVQHFDKSGLGYFMESQQQDEYIFSYDDQGRMVRYDITYGDMYQMSGENKGEIRWDNPDVYGYVEFTYGDFIYYAP